MDLGRELKTQCHAWETRLESIKIDLLLHRLGNENTTFGYINIMDDEEKENEDGRGPS
jgi:hypothetical protein